MAVRRLIALVVVVFLCALVAGGLGWLVGSDGDDVPDGLEGAADSRDLPSPEVAGPQLSADGTRATAQRKPAPTPAGAPPPAEQAAAPQLGPNHIGGVVTDAAGKPIAGATVTLVPPGAAVLKGGGWENATTLTTDEHGRFVHEARQQGAYQVFVRAAGYLRITSRTSRGDAPLRLALHEPVPLAGIITERRTGEPIAKFSLWAVAQTAGLTGPRTQTQTDDDGRFRFSLPEGEAHFVQYPSSPFATWGTAGDWIPTRWGPFLPGREDLVLEIERGLPLAGTVTDASGAEIGEPFRIEVLGRTARGDLDYTRRRFTNTNAKGAFRVSGLPEGLYLVTAKPIASTDGTAPSGLTKREIEGIAAGTEDLVIELSRGEPMAGEIVDDEGNAVTGKGYVYVYPQGSSAGRPDSVRGALDGKGGFSTAPLDPGTAFDLLVTGFEGHTHGRLEGVHSGAAVVQVILQRAGLIKGRIIREDGLPVPVGMGVMATAMGVAAGTEGAHGYTYPSPDGSFTLNGLGDYTFRVAAGGASSGLVAAGFTEGVRPGASDVVVKVKPGVALSGKLEDAHGDPVKTHMLTAMPVGGYGRSPAAWTSIPGEDGKFHFAGVHAGKLRILAYIGGKSVTVGEVTAPAKDVVLTVPEE